MAKKKTKPVFIGMKLTVEQAALLAQLQEAFDSTTKTEVLLRGLELLAKSNTLSTIPALQALSEDQEVTAQPTTSLELARLEAEVRQYSNIVQQTKNKTEGVIRQVVEEISKTDKILSKYGGDSSALVQILLDIQHENNWLPRDALIWVSQKLGVPLSQIYHIATFYKAFSLMPKGRHPVSVCMGSACHVRGAPRLLDKVIEVLKIKPGQISRDMQFSLDTENCPGCCALGPVMVVDGEYYSNPSTKEIKQVIAACK